MRRFKLVRHEDVTGLSGTGHVGDGVQFDNDVVVLRWRTEWPTSVVFYDRGVESVEALHGHGGRTRIEWIDGDDADAAAAAHYFSTYCIHGHHADCRETCKFCSDGCRCECHTDVGA